MRPDLETYYLIDQYLDNKLEGAELAAFENQLTFDSSFAKSVSEQRMLNNFILEAELKDVRVQIEKDLASIPKPSFFRMNWQWIGLGILSLTSILYVSIPSKKELKASVQLSEKKSIDYNKPSVIENKKVVKLENNVSKNMHLNTQVTPQSIEIEVNKPRTAVTIDSVHIATIDLSPTIEHSTNTNILPEVLVNVVEEAKKVDCSTTKIAFSIVTETTCKNSETGSIHIENISGGVAPYSFLLNNKKVKEKNIANLGAGTYQIKISDKNGCVTTNTATVLDKICTPSIQQGAKFNINPSIGETCSIPFDTDKKGTISIYSRGGKVIHRIQNPSNESIVWNGTDGYGALAEAGLYVYLIEYTDGTKVTGEVNIVR